MLLKHGMFQGVPLTWFKVFWLNNIHGYYKHLTFMLEKAWT